MITKWIKSFLKVLLLVIVVFVWLGLIVSVVNCMPGAPGLVAAVVLITGGLTVIWETA